MTPSTLDRLLGDLGLTMRQIASDSGFSRHTLDAWRVGRRVPRPKNLRTLARALERRAKVLNRAAVQLVRAAESEDQ